MKLNKLYSNNDNFKHIQFNLEGLNVVYADVKTSIKETQNAHNLGKTLLAKLIDFMLLKKVGDKRKHFFYKDEKAAKIFENQIFYLELFLNNGRYLTIKRPVATNTKISFSFSTFSVDGFSAPQEWDEKDLAIDKAKIQLNEYLNLDFFQHKSYQFRKAINYSLRIQGDYSDIYRLNKFTGGKDRDWKPFMFDLLGFDGSILYEKYMTDVKIEEMKNFSQNLRREFDIDENQRDEIVGEIQLKENELETANEDVDKFNFYKQDKELIADGIENIESDISRLNTLAYSLEYDINKLKSSLKKHFAFDLEKVKKIFNETQIFFPEKLKKEYKELLDFNKAITVERNKVLKSTLKKKEKEIGEVQKELKSLNEQRQKLLSFLQDTDSFRRFKTFQKRLAHLEGDLVTLKEKLSKIDLINKKNIEQEKLNEKLDKLINSIRELYKSTEKNTLYSGIRQRFSSFYKEIMNETVNISWSINRQGNVDFKSPTIEKFEDGKVTTTSQGDGYTYKKLLCVTFDLAIISNYSDQSYFKFIYHDDVLANEDNGVKHRFLNLLKENQQLDKLQYIMTVIKDDLPIDGENQPIHFSNEQIILNLHDKDESGTLFGFNF